MLIFDIREIGNLLLKYRKKAGLTQAELAEKAQISDRTYADIERGFSNMRVDTLLNICHALNITPNDILLREHEVFVEFEELSACLSQCSSAERKTALMLMQVYLRSLHL